MNATWKGKKSKKKASKTQMAQICRWVPVAPDLLGREKERGPRAQTENLSLALRAWSFVMGPELLITDLIVVPHASPHLRWAADCNPPGGTTAAHLFLLRPL